MVTHEADIAAYARRNIVMRDGLVQRDFAVVEGLNASAALERISMSDALAPQQMPV